MDISTEQHTPILLGATAPQSITGGPSFAGTPANEQKQEIVVFDQDGDVAVSAPMPDFMPGQERFDASDLTSNEISSVLARPILMKTIDWSSSTGSLGELARIHLPLDWLAIPMIIQKLSGFRFFRCDFVVEVQINAQPFNAGALIGWFSPLAQQLGHKPSSEAALSGVTGYHNVQWRCGEETAMKITIPYVSPTSHIDLVTGLGTFGDFVLDIMSPLTGSGDVNGAIWVWAENVRFEMPTGLVTLTPPTLKPNAQAGETPAAAPAAKAPQEKEKKAGMIQTATAVLGGISAALSLIPPLTPFASAASLVFGAASKVASLFGWSKPLREQFATAMMPSFIKNLANFNGSAEAKVLALDAENAVDIPLHLFRTREDEMSFNHILRKPIFMDVFTWTSAQATQTPLWKWQVDPMACRKTARSTGNIVACFNTFLSYVCSFASMWRGSIKYHLKLVKTKFHSGRLEISFVPGATLNTDLATVDFTQVYKRIVDVRETSDIEFEVPFTWAANWKKLTNYNLGGTGLTLTSTSYDPTPTGLVVVRVLNALRAPDTAANHIEALVFTQAGDDFQLAIPRAPGNTAVARSFEGLPQATYTMANAQSGLYPAKRDTSTRALTKGVGEGFVSFRQLLKRYIPISPKIWAHDTSQHTSIINMHMFDDNATFGPVGDCEQQQDAWLWAGSIYRFMTGSQRVAINHSSIGGPIDTRQVGLVAGGDRDNVGQYPSSLPVAGPVHVQTILEPYMEVQTPFYQEWVALPTPVGDPAQTDEILYTTSKFTSVPFNNGSTLIVGSVGDGEGDIPLAFRHIGEDFSFGYLLGPPVTWKWPIGANPTA